MLRSRGDLVGDGVEEVKARVRIVAEQLAERRLSGRGQQIEAEIGGADGVGLFDKKLTMTVVTLDRAGEGKRQQQPKEREDCAFDRSALLWGLVFDAKAAAKLDQHEHDRQHKEGADRIEDHRVEPR